MADNSRAWMAVHTKGSKQMRQRLNAAQANNPAYQEFIQKHGLGDIASAKQSEMTAKKPKAMSPTAPEPNDGSKDRLAAIKAAAEKARQRKELDKRRAAMSDWGGTGGKMGGFSMPSFRTYREEAEQVDEISMSLVSRFREGKRKQAEKEAGGSGVMAGSRVYKKLQKSLEPVERREKAFLKGYGAKSQYELPGEVGSKISSGQTVRGSGSKPKGAMAAYAQKGANARRAVRLRDQATGKIKAAMKEEVELQEQFKTKEAAHTYAIANSKDGYDIDVYKHPNGSYHVNHEMNSQGRNWLIKAGAKKVGVASKGKIKEEVEYIEEKLTAADPASTWISDFVNSDNPKFAGKSKKERMNMALGAYYAKKREKNEEVVQEKLDPVGKETTDIDNDKDVDKTDRYLHARRQAIGKAIARKKGM